MRKVTLAGLRAHKLRLLLTALAIVLGVGFVAGTLTLGDTAKAAFFDQFAYSARNVDVAVQSSGNSTGSGRHRLPASVLDEVRRVPGVAAVDGRMSGTVPMLDRHGTLISNFGAAGVAYNVTPHAGLHGYTLVSGRLPRHDGEAALDTDTAAHGNYHVGDTVTVLDPRQHRHRVRLTGIVKLGTTGTAASTLIMTSSDVARFSGHSGYQEIVATAAAGVDEATLTDRVRAAVGHRYTVKSGDTLRTDLASDAVSQIDIFLTALLIFGVIAMAVSAFVIYNTFTILLAQRTRELALLRCVGASRRQVFGSVLAESALVGLVASAVGLVFGMLLAYGMYAGLSAFGVGLPSHGLVISPGTVLIGLLAGVVVTVGSALLPAAGSTRVPPMAALHSRQPGTGGRRHTVVRIVVAALIGGVGAVLTLAGVSAGSSGGSAVMAMLLVVAGGLVVFLGLVVISPLFLGRLTALVGWLPGRLFGVPGRLAGANARRNPGRVAATTTALMIGVALMTIFSVMLATVRTTTDEEMAKSFPADYFLSSVSTGQADGVPDAAVAALRHRDELATVTVERFGALTVGGRHTRAAATDSDTGPQVTRGSLSDLGTGTIALHQGIAASLHRTVGDRVEVTADGHRRRLRVVALYTGSGPMMGGVMLSWHQFGVLYGPGPADEVMVTAAHGVSPERSRAAVDAVVRDYPLVQVSSMAEIRARTSNSFDSLLGIFAALLGISIIIALFGIANTLSLSVFERTRESALLRALGLTRGQLRGMLLVEALLMAVVGALIGIVFGVVFGAAATRAALGGLGGSVHLPVGQLLLYLALAAAAGVLAAVLPARRAARTSVVAAMAET